jgi:hypothetical protein
VQSERNPALSFVLRATPQALQQLHFWLFSSGCVVAIVNFKLYLGGVLGPDEVGRIVRISPARQIEMAPGHQ